MEARQIYPVLISILLAVNLQAQPIQPLPRSVFTREESMIRTTLYVPDSNQLLVFHQNKCWLTDREGKILRGPFILQDDGTDAWYPRISASGKTVVFYIPEPDWMADNDRMALYNLDSGYIVGTYKIPMMSDIDRVRFSGDSIFHYYTSYDKYKGIYTWYTGMGKVKLESLVEDSSHSGVYDLAYYKDRIVGAVRSADTLLLVSTDSKRQFFEVFKLGSVSVKNIVQFSQGYPYALAGDEGTGQTRIFKPADTSFILIATLPLLPEIYAAAGTGENCYILYRDTASKNDRTLKLFDTRSGTARPVTGVPPDAAGYIYNIYPEKELFTASHPTNGTITAFNLTDTKEAWTTSPKPASAISVNNKPGSTDNRLFKVLIKQGSENVASSHYNAGTNQISLVKNNGKLVTVDADAKCAVRWEQFYKDDNRLSIVKLLPGTKYILYSEEKWKKNLNADDLDVERFSYQYPYAAKVFDRESAKIIFNLQSQDPADIRVLNDSLIYWLGEMIPEGRHSVTIYNLNTGVAKNIRPFPPGDITGYTVNFINGRFYYLMTTGDKKLMLANESGKIIFREPYPYENELEDTYLYVDNSPYFYFNGSEKKTGSPLYKIQGDSVLLIKRLPPGISVLAAKSTPTGVYFMYKKEYVRKKENVYHYRLINMMTGKDRLIDSVGIYNDKTYAKYEPFPEENYYTKNTDNIISWHDLNSGYEFKNFGRDETSIISIAYSPEGRYLAAANPDGKVMLWDLGTGKETRTLTVGTGGYITKLAFSGDGQYLAASSGDIWETATGKNVVSVTDGSIWAVNSIDFSLDGKRIISGGACVISWDAADGSKLIYHQEPGEKDMDKTNQCWNRYGCVSPDYKFMVHSTAIHPNSQDFVVGNMSGVIQKWNTELRALQAYKVLEYVAGQTDRKVYDLKYTRDGNYVIAVQQKCIYRLDATTLAVQDSLLIPEGEEILGIDMGYDNLVFGCITRRKNERIFQIRNITDLKVKQEFYAEGASFNKISFSPNKTQAATASDDGFCTIWDLASGKPVMYLSTIGEYGNIMVTPDNYYMASKSALEGVTFFKDSSFYSFDQFDLYLNRPDIVLNRLGYASPELLNFYRNAYYKRLKKITGNVNDTVVNDYVPSLKLSNKKSIPVVTDTGSAALVFEIADSSAQKGTIRIYINGNLVKEHRFTETIPSSLTYADSVVLSQGINNIEAVYSSQSSIESRKEKVSVAYSPRKRVQPKVWFIGVGISKYRDADMNLKYPVKDIRDIARDFKKKYPGIIIDTLLNEKATRENILALHDKLMNTSVNDKVIVSFSGHGLLSDSLDWYFATQDIDFKKPEQRGLPYSMMEGILNGIPARQKLLLLDACHSGEVDKESDITFANKETGMEEDVVATAKGVIIKGRSQVGLQTSFELMQDMFANLGKGNGTTVLSAAGGKEYAFESDKWKNGVFTYSLLKALKDPATDENQNKKISVRELKKAVFDAVKKLTGGRQKPTSRVEVLDDWDIW